MTDSVTAVLGISGVFPKFSIKGLPGVNSSEFF